MQLGRRALPALSLRETLNGSYTTSTGYTTNSVTAGVIGLLPTPWGWCPMAPFFGDSDRGETRVVTVCGRCGRSEAHADGR